MVIWCRLQFNFNFPDTDSLDLKLLNMLNNSFIFKERCERLVPLILNASENILVIFKAFSFGVLNTSVLSASWKCH